MQGMRLVLRAVERLEARAVSGVGLASAGRPGQRAARVDVCAAASPQCAHRHLTCTVHNRALNHCIR